MNTNNNEFLKNYKGLTDEEVKLSLEKNGVNSLMEKTEESFLIKILSVFKEPVFLLLIIAASVYFIVGEYGDGIVMLIFVFGICFIEFMQESKTDKALEELNKLSALNVKVIRNEKVLTLSSNEIVVGDLVLLEEGDKVPADGKIVYAQSLGINESLLTGESAVVYKSTIDDNENHFKLNFCYSGTDVVNGMALIKVVSVGKNTEFGKVGESLNEIESIKTPLENQINKLVFVCTIICGIVFILTICINFINHSELVFKERLVDSILSGITIAMATIPEEIPVVLTVFLAMGAWELTRKKALTRNVKTIETLGAVDVLCTDKTGTLTENKMKVQDVYAVSDTFMETSYYACSSVAYDPMEIAIKNYCILGGKRKFKKVTREYAFTSESKMMGQIWDNNVLCVKGAYESVLPLCNLSDEELKDIKSRIIKYSNDGFRVLVVAKSEKLKVEPSELLNAKLFFEGLIALYDPPRYSVKKAVSECVNAGIRVIMITGDNGETAKGIGKKINLPNCDNVITGYELENMSDEELFEKVKSTNIFARVYPNHKLRIVNALQKDTKIVAMTGDGINDAPALKKANVGIAMGQRGTNVAKEAADIVLLDDNFKTIVDSIKNGRNIYKNIKKSISYILAIHMPVALLAIISPLFKLPTLLLPIHVMLLELLIDPTSSIVFQRIKPEKDIMSEKPRSINEPLISLMDGVKSVCQGLMIFVVVFLNYYLLIKNDVQVSLAITISYSILVLSIMLIAYQLKNNKLTVVNFIDSFKDKVSLFINFGIMVGLVLIIYVPLFNSFANTMPLGLKWWIHVILSAFVAVIPFDIFKMKKK